MAIAARIRVLVLLLLWVTAVSCEAPRNAGSEPETLTVEPIQEPTNPNALRQPAEGPAQTDLSTPTGHQRGGASTPAAESAQGEANPRGEPSTRADPNVQGQATAIVIPTSQPDPPMGVNLINNPWFRDASDNTKGGLDGWSQATVLGEWGVSQKGSNPSPDNVVGTAARWGDSAIAGNITGVPGIDAYLFQVVSAGKTHSTLVVQLWFVTLDIDEVKVSIYGSESKNGPWTEVWVPWQSTTGSMPRGKWNQTPVLTTELEKTFGFYKFELHGRYKDTDGTAAVKYTGVYFATAP